MNNTGRFVYFLLIFIFILPACRTDQDNDQADTVTKWSLWSNGTQLRGINIWQKKIDRELDGNFLGNGTFGPPFKKEDFEKLKSFGVNYINISHPGIYTVESPYIPDQGALANLRDLITMIGESDMFVVISFRTGPGRSEYTFYFGEDYQSDPKNGWFDEKYYNEEVWSGADARNGWVKMWKLTAKEFQNNPYVAGYDLMVEPNSSEVLFDISEPEDFYPQYEGTLQDWNILYPKLINGIRETDKDTPIIAGASFYSSLNWLPYLKIVQDEKTIYAFHQYSPYIYTHQSTGDNIYYPGSFDIDWDTIPDNFNKSWLTYFFNTATDYIQGNNALVTANEYGCVRWAGNAKDFLRDEMDIFESIGINYAIWAWSSGHEPYRTEIDAFNYLMGPDPGNKSDIDDNELIGILKSFWTKNTKRPSNTVFW